ncbi:ABC transporter ATP-binding protein [Enterococcus faecalis]|uniref:ABC transporter ATP-binding protein n=1 Tax=Enterococcus faecalis TaxID=1351 RepID=UPI002B002BD7|nr:ABC transporter ATP-binding protein [Enterococcus faecalis]
MIRLDNISYGYTKKNNILNEISFTIKDGDCLAVLGHNGSGKTTLAYLIIGLLKQQTGNIYNQFSKIAYLPEHGGTYKNLSVINNLKFKAKLEGIAQDSYIIENYLQDFGLESSKHKLVLHLSQGLEKRLALAMFFLTNCQLLYLDEPTNTLDPEMIIKLKQRVNSLRESGKH